MALKAEAAHQYSKRLSKRITAAWKQSVADLAQNKLNRFGDLMRPGAISMMMGWCWIQTGLRSHAMCSILRFLTVIKWWHRALINIGFAQHV